MKFPLLACCLTLFVSCATPAPTDSWSEGTLSIALSLDSHATDITNSTSQIFDENNSQRTAALEAINDLTTMLRHHSEAWRIMFGYAITSEMILSSSKLGCDKASDIALAFHHLHGKLYQGKLAAQYGIDENAHYKLLFDIRQCSSAQDAFATADRGVEIICQSISNATQTVAVQVKRLNARLIELQAADNKVLTDRQQQLLNRQQRYLTDPNPAYDVQFELAQVATELSANQSNMQHMRSSIDKINELLLQTTLLIEQCSSASQEWAACNNALSRSAAVATQNFRLFKERAEVISSYK
ncbi:MAG: hypothetical protein H8E25_09480 [Planctomycetes bacterium]|nr:hypothetical protein [Planctomycetota bacterium]